MTKTILTDRQIEILKLKGRGLTQTEIAKRLGTSRANISATEKTTRENIEKAKNTMELVRMIDAPLRITIEPETDLNTAVRAIYDKADSAGIWIAQSFPSLASMIQNNAKGKIKGRRILFRLEAAITKEGEVIVR